MRNIRSRKWKSSQSWALFLGLLTGVTAMIVGCGSNSTPSAPPVPTATYTNTVCVNGGGTPCTSTPSFTSTATGTPTNTSTTTYTPTSTQTPTNTATATSSSTATNSATPTATGTPTSTGTNTATATATSTFSSTGTPTFTSTPTDTATNTSTGTPTDTATNSATPTSTPTSPNSATTTPPSTPTATFTFQATPHLVATWTIGGSFSAGPIAISGSTLYNLDQSASPYHLRAYNLSATPIPTTTWPVPTMNGGDYLGVDGGGNVYVAGEPHSGSSDQIVEYNPQATPVATFVPPGYGSALAVAVDGSGNVYEGNYALGQVDKYNSSSVYQTAWSLPDPSIYGMSASGTTIFAALPYASPAQVVLYSSAGVTLNSWPIMGASEGGPIAFNSAGNLYMIGQSTTPAQRYTPSGILQTQWGSFQPRGVAVDGSDNIYISDSRGYLFEYAP